MVLNNGTIQLGGGGATIRIYYDPNWLINNPTANPDLAPLVNGPRGFCLDVTNTTGHDVHLVVSGTKNQPLDVTVQQGDPVTSGGGQSRTVTQMAQAGFTTRGDVGQVTIS